MQPLSLPQFRQPPARARLAPFWFWNCDMNEELIRRQVAQMAQGGCGGFFIHPRQGMTLPYLSKTYFARVRLAVEAAREFGMEVWLYDEYPYPSGIAGGLVTANRPELRARVLDVSEFSAHQGEAVRREWEMGRVVYALAYPVENGALKWEAGMDLRDEIGAVLTRELFWFWPMGHIPTNEKRFMADEGKLVLEWTPPAGEWQVFVGVEREQRGFKYYDCFFDPLAPGAVEEFMRLTHARYAAELGEFFGETIVGIFTDETEPPAWSPHIARALGLEGDAASLIALRRADHPRARELRLAWRECALRLFGERWEMPIADWCRAHHLLWGAEKPTWRPSQFWGVAQPATDAGHRRIPAPPEPLTAELRANHRAAISAAEACGTEEVRCECFHSLGWGATLQDQKWQFDWLCAQGVNRFTPHAFYATSAGLKKHDAAPSFFVENPYWAHFKLLADYVARLSLAMSSGRERARVAVVHPTQSLWLGDNAVRADYERLLQDLLANHVQFHIVDAQTILNAQAAKGALEIGCARYETLLIPDEPEQSSSIAAARHKAQDAGLAVTAAANWREVALRNPLQLRDENGADLPAVWTLWRETETQQLLFFANTGGAAIRAHIEVKTDVATWEIWSLESGEVAPLPSEFAGSTNRFALTLPPYGSALLVATPHSDATGANATGANATMARRLPLDGEWQLELDRPNALRLNRWRAIAANDDGDAPAWDDADWREIEALPLRYLDARGGGWTQPLERRAGQTVWYRRRINCEFVPRNLEILIENGAIAGDWSLFVNGAPVPATAFAPRLYNGADKTAAPLSALFRTGENMLLLKVENAPPMGGLVTPLHLIGDFALSDDATDGGARRTLTRLSATARFGEWVEAGLPHFSGAATYRKALDWGDARTVELPAEFGEIAELRVAGASLGVRAWSPYRWNLTPTNGPVETEVVVTNTLLPFVEGQQWNSRLGVTRNV